MSLSDHGSPAYTRGLTPVGGCPTKTAPLSRPKRQNMPPHRGRKGFFLSRHRFTPQNFKYNTLLDGLIEQAAFNQALVTHPEDEFASVLVGDLAQFVDTNSGVKIYGSKEEIRARKSPETVDASGFVPDASIPVTLYVITQHYRFLEIAFRKSVYDSKKNLMHRTHLSFDSSVVSETAPSSRSVTT